MNGELIAIEYHMELEQKVFMSFSTASGDPLIDIDYQKHEIYALPAGWQFNKFTPGSFSIKKNFCSNLTLSIFVGVKRILRTLMMIMETGISNKMIHDANVEYARKLNPSRVSVPTSLNERVKYSV